MLHIKKEDSRTTEQKKEAILETFRDCCNISKSCKKNKITRTTFYRWLNDDTAFKQSFNEAAQIAIGVLEDEAKRRALEGVSEPVYYLGKKVGTVKKYSDTLLIVLLKAHAPEKYKERNHTELTGRDGQPIQVENSQVVVYVPENNR